MLKIKQFIIGLLVTITSLAANAVTLEDALISAYKTNPELNSQRESLKASDEEIMQALSKWLPSVTARATKRYDKAKKVGVFNSNGTLAGSVNSSSDARTHSLTISQNLFRSGADMASIKVAKAQINQARAKLDNKEQEVLIKSIEAYMNALATKKIYQIAQIKEKDNAKLLTGAKHRFKAGDASKTDVAVAEAELSSAKSERAIAQANYETAKASFKAVTGLQANNLTLPHDRITLPKTIDETIDAAIIKNPKILDVKNSADASKQAIGVQRGGVLPSIDLQHQISDDTNQGYSSSRGLRNYTTTIQLSIPLFPVKEWSLLRRTKRTAAAEQNSMSFTIKAVRASATQAWVKLQADKKTLKAREAEHKARKIAYDGVKASEQVGLASTLDTIRVQNEYFKAYTNFISARSDYYISLYTLKSIIGECTAKELKLNTEYYNPLKNYNSIKWQLIGAF